MAEGRPVAELLLRCARERARFARELEIEAQVLGARVPLTNGSGAHALADTELVAACRVGEESALREYEQTLRMPLPVELERMLRGHHAALREGVHRLYQLA